MLIEREHVNKKKAQREDMLIEREHINKKKAQREDSRPRRTRWGRFHAYGGIL